MTEHDQMLELIRNNLKTSTGRFKSRCLNEAWFKQNNLTKLYDYVLNTTQMISDRSLSEKLWALEHWPVPVCECGKPVKKYDNKDFWSSYCSSKCSLHSTKRSALISATKKSVDSTASNIKRKQKMLQKYGYETNSQRPEVKQKLRELRTKSTNENWQLLSDSEWLTDQHVTHLKSVRTIARELHIDYGTVLNTINNLGILVNRTYCRSEPELAIEKFLNDLGVETIPSYKPDWLGGRKELDLFVPSKAFAIEINGCRYHNENFKHKTYHLDKLLACQQNGVKLFQVTDWQWWKKNTIVKSMITARVGVANKIHARCCEVVHVSWSEAKQFLEQTHISGAGSASKMCYALKHNNTIVALSTFGKSRFNNLAEWELLRFSSMLNTVVVGGLAKLIKHFTTQHSASLMTYADRRFGEGLAYQAIGMQFRYSTQCGYCWVNSNEMLSRFQTQRHNLQRLLGSKFDPSLTETENMANAGYVKMYDCGHNVYVL